MNEDENTTEAETDDDHLEPLIKTGLETSTTTETGLVVDDPAEEKRVDEPDAVETTVTTEVRED